MLRISLALSVAALSLLPAHAAEIRHTGSWDGPSAQLYLQLGGLGFTSLDTPAEVDARQILVDDLWTMSGGGPAGATMLFEIAGLRDHNRMGIFDAADPSRRLTIWDGAASAGSRATMTATFTAGGVTFIAGGEQAQFLGDVFGFWLSNTVLYWSDATRNAGRGDRMATWQGGGETLRNGLGTFSADTFLIAWEDLPLGHSDEDFNDLVLMARGIVPLDMKGGVSVPEAGTVLLLVAGGASLMALRRRRATRS